MFRIAVCDDDKIVLEDLHNRIKSLSSNMNKITDIRLFSDGNEMLAAYENDADKPDIIFLDISMPTIDGFKVAELIRGFNENLIIIFLTSMEELVYESFKYKPFRFIRKNKLNDELEDVLFAAFASIEKTEARHYVFKTYNGEVRFKTTDILYIESLHRKIYLKDDKRLHSLAGIQFGEIVNALQQDGFVLIHRSCIVNLKYIYSIGRIDITLDNGEKLPMSRYKVNDVKKAFTLYAV